VGISVSMVFNISNTISLSFFVSLEKIENFKSIQPKIKRKMMLTQCLKILFAEAAFVI
jgi:hypothetical protein